MFLPTLFQQQYLDKQAQHTLVKNEFYHTLVALRRYLGQAGTRTLTLEDDTWIMATAVDCHRDRWGSRGVDYSQQILALIPDYALLEEASFQG